MPPHAMLVDVVRMKSSVSDRMRHWIVVRREGGFLVLRHAGGGVDGGDKQAMGRRE